MAGRRPPPGPPVNTALPSRPQMDRQRGRADDYGEGTVRSAGFRSEESRYDRGSYAPPSQGDRGGAARYPAKEERDGPRRLSPHRGYSNEWGREQDQRDRREPFPSGTQQRRQRDRSRSPPTREGRWGGGRPPRPRSPSLFDETGRGTSRRSPSPTESSMHRSRVPISDPPRDSGYPTRGDRQRELTKDRPERARDRDTERPPSRPYHDEDSHADIRSLGPHREEVRGSSPISASSRQRHSPPPPRRSRASSVSTHAHLGDRPHQASDERSAGPPGVNPFALPASSIGSISQQTLTPVGPSSGIPTGPKASFAPRGRGRGGIPIRGGIHFRGAVPHGVPGAPYMPTGRERGCGPTGWGARGRGGIIGGMTDKGTRGGVEDPPARSLVRKVDAGGNAVLPDLISVPSVASTARNSNPSAGQTAHEELEEGEREEGEREEGEMDDFAPDEQMAVSDSDQRTIPRQEANLDAEVSHVISTQPERHLGTLPSRQPYSQPIPSSSAENNVPSTPSTPAVTTATPGMLSSSHSAQNPYSASGWQRPVVAPAGISAPSTIATATPASVRSTASAAAKTTASYTATNFPKSVKPEWDAELWTLSAHRLAALHHLPTSSNFYVPPPAAIATTPGSTSVPSSVVAGLKSALTDLREAMTELEMASIRSQECERSRAEAAQL